MSRITKNEQGTTYSVSVSDCDTNVIKSLTNVTEPKIIFYKPDGTRFEKIATIVDDPDNANEKILKYLDNSNTVSILDNTGLWQFGGSGRLPTSGYLFETVQRKNFWVT